MQTYGYVTNEPAISANNRLPLSPAGAGHQRPRVFHEIVDEHGPRAVLVVVGHLIVDSHSEIEKQIPRVLRYRPLVVLL